MSEYRFVVVRNETTALAFAEREETARRIGRSLNAQVLPIELWRLACEDAREAMRRAVEAGAQVGHA